MRGYLVNPDPPDALARLARELGESGHAAAAHQATILSIRARASWVQVNGNWRRRVQIMKPRKGPTA